MSAERLQRAGSAATQTSPTCADGRQESISLPAPRCLAPGPQNGYGRIVINGAPQCPRHSVRCNRTLNERELTGTTSGIALLLALDCYPPGCSYEISIRQVGRVDAAYS